MNYIHGTLFCNNADIIIKGNKSHGTLWLGNRKSAMSEEFLTKNKISLVINCTVEEENVNVICDSFRIPVRDSLLDFDINLMTSYYDIARCLIESELFYKKQNVIVNCFAGKQRSASVIAITLFDIITRGLIKGNTLNNTLNNTVTHSELLKNIINYILIIRPQAFSFGWRINFKKSICDYLGVEF